MAIVDAEFEDLPNAPGAPNAGAPGRAQGTRPPEGYGRRTVAAGRDAPTGEERVEGTARTVARAADLAAAAARAAQAAATGAAEVAHAMGRPEHAARAQAAADVAARVEDGANQAAAVAGTVAAHAGPVRKLFQDLLAKAKAANIYSGRAPRVVYPRKRPPAPAKGTP